MNVDCTRLLIIQNNLNKDVIDAPLYQADKFGQECSQLLENCTSAAANNDYVIQPSNLPVAVQQQQRPPVTKSQQAQPLSPTNTDDGNYLFQPSNRPVEEEYLHQSRNGLNRMGSSQRLAHQPTYGTLKRSASDASSSARSTVDDELAEIMHDFKNNVLSIREVEVLVEKWKHRNDVQQSFREKQEQIDQLRKEYERIQDQVRSQLKRETPFDKL